MRPIGQLTELSEIFTQSTLGPQALAEVLPGHMIEEAVAEHGREAQRKRKLPPPTVVWLIVGMSLFRDLSIKNVLLKLVQELGLDVSWGVAEAPVNTSTTHARDRLGWQVLRTLYFKLVSLLIGRQPELDMWKDLPTYALDGSSFPTPDTADNEAAFGRPGTGRASSSRTSSTGRNTRRRRSPNSIWSAGKWNSASEKSSAFWARTRSPASAARTGTEFVRRPMASCSLTTV